jgi:hypothetical protein
MASELRRAERASQRRSDWSAGTRETSNIDFFDNAGVQQ